METNKETDHANDNKNDSINDPIPLKQPGEIYLDKSESNQGKDRSGENKNVSSPIAITAIIINVILAIFTFLLWYEASSQSRYSQLASQAAIQADSIAMATLDFQIRKDFRDSISQSKKDILFETSQRQRDSLNYWNFMNETRAYIVIDNEKGIQWKLKPGELIQISPWCKNVGKTPAFNYYHVYINLLSGIGIREPTEKDLDTIFSILNRHGKSGVALGTNLSQEMLSGLKASIMTDEAYKALYNGSANLYRMGAIIYYDVFGKKHFTWYCLKFDSKRNLMVSYPKFNGMN